jgi:TPR repeat protein
MAALLSVLRHARLFPWLVSFVTVSSAWAGGPPPSGFDAAALETRAQSGDAAAAFDLGTLDYVGLSVVQDYIGAVAWLKKSALAGNGDAQCELGFLYQTGSFGQGPPPPDPKDAVPWYAQAVAQGNVCGEFALGELYASGQGVPKDQAKATALLARAAAQGLAADPSVFPLQQLQQRFYAVAYKLTGERTWVDLVSIPAGGGE